MKRFFLAALMLLSLHQYAFAQATDSVIHDTVVHRCERFYYEGWYEDSCQDFLESTMRLFDLGRNLTSFFHTQDSIAVKGLAAMVMRDEDLTPYSPIEIFYSPDHGFLPEYLSLWLDSNYILHLAADSLRVDTVIPRVMRLPLSARDSSRYALCLLYQVFFDKPVIVDSIFAIAGTGNSNRGIWIDSLNGRYWKYYKRWRYATVTDVRRLISTEDFTIYCHNPSPLTNVNFQTGGYCLEFDDRKWGPFFAIADFYNLNVISSDTTRGSVNGSGRFSSDVPRRITAVPAPGYRFRRWNDGNTHNPRTVFLTQDTLFTAFFTDSIPLRLIAQPNRSYQGQVTGSGNYWAGDTATLTATPNENYRFTRWNDGDTNSTRIVVVTQDTTFTAFFEWIDQHEDISAPDGQFSTLNSQFSITPNPARNSVTVTLNSQLPILNSQFSLTLSDAAGRELLNTKVSTPNFQLSISQYPAGTYFVTLRTPDATSTQRLVIE